MVKKEIDAKLKIMPTQDDDSADNSPFNNKAKGKTNNTNNNNNNAKYGKKTPLSNEVLPSPRKTTPRSPSGNKKTLSQEPTSLPEETRKVKSIKSVSRKKKLKKTPVVQEVGEPTKSASRKGKLKKPVVPVVQEATIVPEPDLSQDGSGNSSRVSSHDLKVMEQQFGSLDCFHGYICREDLPCVLKKVGDYLIRISVHMTTSEKIIRLKKKKSTRIEVKRDSREVLQSTMLGPEISGSSPVDRDYVVSVFAKIREKGTTNLKKNNTKIRNVSVKKVDGQFCLETNNTFRTINDLLDYYKSNIGLYKGWEFQLLYPVSLSNWEYKHKDVELLDKKLGEGAFGEVREARLKWKDNGETKTINIAVKMLKNADNVNREQVSELLHEGRIMRYLDHKNVLRFFGLAVLSEPLYLMSELCSLGALREYLKENGKNLALSDKLMFCLGSAKGVEYLHSQKLIHRDLAVRNVLLTEDKTPKVSDFGLAKVTDRYEMKEACKIPVRYLAPETLETFVFTHKSDVFSFGMVVWEIYENGTQPHDGKNAHTIRELTKKNQFLKINDVAPTQLRKFVSDKIFVSDPENRCNMSAVVQMLEKLSIKDVK